MTAGVAGDDGMTGNGRPRLLAVDIDGTMIRSDGTLSLAVKDALHRAVGSGIHVVPTTGRPEAVARDIVAASELDQYWIFANGAVTRHLARNETVRGFWIEREVALDVVAAVRDRRPDLGFAVEFESSLAYEVGFEAVVPNPLPVPAVDRIEPILETGSDRIQKLLLFDPSVPFDPTLDEVGKHRQRQRLDVMFSVVGEVARDRAVPSYSGLPFVELAARHVTKALALAALADQLTLSAHHVVAVGDNHNDIPMLEWAGVGLAMGNATDDAKKAADRTIGSNDDDGLAHAINDLLDVMIP